MAKCCIIIGQINKKLLLPLLAGLIQIIYDLINIFDKCNRSYEFYNSFLSWLVISISQISVRLYPLILKISNEQKPKVQMTKKKKFLHYFFLCLIFIPMIVLGSKSDLFDNASRDNDPSHKSNNLFPNNNPITICFEMIFLICISISFLKYKYFKHHIISLIILILIGIIFIFYNIFRKYLKEEYILPFILRIPHAVLDAIYRCYQKYLMEKFYYPYWNIALVPGIILFPIALVFFVLQIKDEFFEFNIKRNFLGNFIIFKIVLPLVFNFIICPLTIMTVYYFSPDYILIITILANISENIKICISLRRFNIFLLLNIIQIFALLIYLEILELNFCGLNKNTKRNIHLRGESDSSFDQRESISENNNIDININYSLELEEKTNEDIKNEEEKEEENFIN